MDKIIALLCGLVFGIGLTVSQMVDPNKVLNFLDITGSWDPSLMFVMGGALMVYILSFQLLRPKFKSPIFSTKFDIPTLIIVDKKLIIGSAFFGIGWGIAGICPGPALTNVMLGNEKVFGFIIAMTIGMWVANKVK